MVSNQQKIRRRDQILQALAQMLQNTPGQRITTAKLAATVGVSEAALYRHFPSKARMFEGLIEFIEESLFSQELIDLKKNMPTAPTRCQHMLHLILTFAERNPGITRMMTGDALVGEHERLRVRVSQLYARLETQFKQILREERLYNANSNFDAACLAHSMMIWIEGALSRFVRSGFENSPTAYFSEHWHNYEHYFHKAPESSAVVDSIV